MSLRLIGFIPIPALIIIIVILNFTVGPSVFYDPGWLILITNTLFVSVVCFIVAYISMQNYRATGRIQILLLGCGVLAFGIGGVIAGFVRGLPDGANLNVTIYNTGALAGALFHFTAAFILLADISLESGSKNRASWLFFCYSGITIFMLLLSLATYRGIMPLFSFKVLVPHPCGKSFWDQRMLCLRFPLLFSWERISETMRNFYIGILWPWR